MTATNNATTEQWGVFELELVGSAEGNPFLEVELTAQFSYKHRTIEVDGFYDGDGVYRIRFMPDTQGNWRYRTHSNRDELSGVEGTFTCIAPAPGNQRDHQRRDPHDPRAIAVVRIGQNPADRGVDDNRERGGDCQLAEVGQARDA